MCFPKPPKPPPPPAPPSRNAALEESDRLRQRLAARRGLQATVLTSPQGVGLAYGKSAPPTTIGVG